MGRTPKRQVFLLTAVVGVGAGMAARCPSCEVAPAPPGSSNLLPVQPPIPPLRSTPSPYRPSPRPTWTPTPTPTPLPDEP